MNELLERVIEAHGGMDLWRRYTKVEASIVTGGGFFALKNVLQDRGPLRIAVWTQEQRSSLQPYGAADQRAMFTPARVTIEKLDGTLLAERWAPKDSFAGHQMSTPWDPLHRAYFNGEALWTYLTTPFFLASPGVRVEELAPWEGKETWRVLRAFFPAAIETHSLVQEFYFGADLLLRRHDYRVNIAGGFAAAQLMTQYGSAGGVSLPAQRRAYISGPDRRPVTDMLMVSIDISEIQFS